MLGFWRIGRHDGPEDWRGDRLVSGRCGKLVFAVSHVRRRLSHSLRPPVQDCHGGRPCGLAGHPRSLSGPVDPARSLSPQYVGRCITQTRTPCRRHRMPANKALSTECRQNYAFFVFLHFARSEALEDQDQSVALHHRFLPSELWRARRCRDIITHFGRFPNRQRIFNRTLPPEESRYLNTGGFQG